LRESMQIIPWAFVSGRYVPRFPRDLFAPVYGWFTEGRHARLEGGQGPVPQAGVMSALVVGGPAWKVGFCAGLWDLPDSVTPAEAGE